MSLDPIRTVEKLEKEYKDFLGAQFCFRNHELSDAAVDAIKNEADLFHGPYIEASMPYRTAETLKTLVEQKKLNPGIRLAFSEEEYAVYKRYSHQVRAFDLVSKGHNIVVSSGTGSGKTECFLVPVINSLLDESLRGELSPGVRAILVYPMNALANDQMDRFRTALKNLPEITFGRYIGETPRGNRADAKKEYRDLHDGEAPLPNELLTRDEMHKKPPHILVTNYAMLEYMLLRPEVNTIFQGNNARHFKYLILDEAHTYHGAGGTEVAMLIRRLKERIFGRSDNCLQCIATSATLGGGKDDADKVALFASQLFSEKFTGEDIILSESASLEQGDNNKNPLSVYKKLLDAHNGNDTDELCALLNCRRETVEDALYDFLVNDKFAYDVRSKITREVLTIGELVGELIPDEDQNVAREALTSLVELGSKIKNPNTGLPLINAKYHVFVRSLEGGFICFYPRKKIFTERHNEYNGCPVYELMNCIRCGQEHILGNIEYDEKGTMILKPTSTQPGENMVFMICNEDVHTAKEDEDEWDSVKDIEDTAIEDFYLCPKCGKLYEIKDVGCCGVDKVHLLRVKSQRKTQLCLQCGRNRPGTLKRMMTGEDASTEILTRTLYQLLPPEKPKAKESKKEEASSIYDEIYDGTERPEPIMPGRKLLMFSDSRQEAARFAMFLQNRYNEWLWKNLIWSSVHDLEDIDGVSFDRLVSLIQKKAKNYGMFLLTDSDDDEKSRVATQLMKEFIELEPRISLAGLGLIEIYCDLDFISPKAFNTFTKYGFTDSEARLLYEELFNSLRKQGAVQFPDNVDPADDAFAPRNKIFSFKRQGGEKTGSKEEAFGWLPSENKSNRRADYIRRILLRKNYSETEANGLSRKILSEIYDENGFVRFFSGRKFIIENPNNGHLSLNYRSWRFSRLKRQMYVCDKCGATTTINIEGVCEQTNCDGHLKEFDAATLRDDFFRMTYKNMKPIPMNVAEHTAQLTSLWATKVQNDFKDNKINVLSCSTTFEMGVDIGSLESVMLRNVPPETSNYVQRAGRAGRRNSSAALILTFAKRRSHDLSFFAEPQKMIKGKIKAPYLTLNNEYLIKRHLQSVVMAYFFMKYPRYYSPHVKSLLNEVRDANVALYEMLNEHPADLLKSMITVLPEEAKDFFSLNDWKWISDLVSNCTDESSVFDNAILSYREEWDELNALKQKYSDTEKFRQADYASSLIKTHEQQELIGFLSANGIVPRYGFPVDVVPLKIRDHTEEARRIDLTRDLKMAITEYGPGTEVIAGNRVWRPYALRTQGDKKWPTMDIAICDRCGHIYSYTTVLGEDAPDRQESCCGKELRYLHILKPVFGFTTKENTGKKAQKTSSEAMHYASTSYFEGFSDDSLVIEKRFEVHNNRSISTKYAPQGKMLVINNGAFAGNDRRGQKFKICPRCGYMTTPDNVKKTHQRSDGKECACQLKSAYLGHDFCTDVLQISLPLLKETEIEEYSILYAIIEGASKCLDIDRRELGGARVSIWNGELTLSVYDTVSGGAGHVKHIQDNMLGVLHEAYDKVSGKCGCGEETSCYGCLRNYDNQMYHDIMSRGKAKKYFAKLLGIE